MHVGKLRSVAAIVTKYHLRDSALQQRTAIVCDAGALRLDMPSQLPKLLAFSLASSEALADDNLYVAPSRRYETRERPPDTHGAVGDRGPWLTRPIPSIFRTARKYSQISPLFLLLLIRRQRVTKSQSCCQYFKPMQFDACRDCDSD